MTWMGTGDLSCSTCGTTFRYPGPPAIVLNAARAHGWHLYEGPSLTGQPLVSHLCERCIGSARSALAPVVSVFSEEPPLTLFDVREEIDRVIAARTPEVVTKAPRAPRKQPPRQRTPRPPDEEDVIDEQQ